MGRASTRQNKTPYQLAREELPRVQRGLAAALRDRRTQLSAAAFVLTALACYLYVLVGNINNYDNIVCRSMA